MTQRRVFNRALTYVLTLSCAIFALAPRADARDPDDTALLIDAMPSEARLVIVADDLGAALATPAGRSLERAIIDSGFFRPTFQQWTELSERLGLEPREAIDALLGRRVVFVGRELSPPAVGAVGVGGGADGAWGLMIWIPAEIEKRVRKNLTLAPRAKVAGQPVLAAEHGAFSLALFMTRGADGRDQTILLLAPAADDSMLKPLIRSLVSLSAPENRASRERGAPVVRFPRTDTAFLHVSAKPTNGASFQLAARPTPRGWEAQLRIEKPGDLRDLFGERAVSQERFQELAPGALALLMESAPDRFDTADDSGMLISSMFAEVPERFMKLMGGRTLVMVERAGPQASGLSVTLASEATYPGDPVAEGDRAIGALISPAPASAPPEGAIEGQYPLAVRTASLKIGQNSVLGARTKAAWAFSTPRPGAQSWWALRLSPEETPGRPASALRPFVDALVSEPHAPQGERPIALGLIRPSALREALADAPWTALRPVEALSWFERVSWSFTLAPPAPQGGKPVIVLIGHAELDMRLGEGVRLGAPAQTDAP